MQQFQYHRKAIADSTSIAVLVLFNAMCATPDNADSAGVNATRSDSAGIEIIENIVPIRATEAARGLSGTRWIVDSIPTLRIGRLDGPDAYTFDRVEAALPLEDGRLVIVDRGKRQLIVFDSTGVHLRTLGGPGEGPGEFGPSFTATILPPDTIKVWDSGNSRLSWFDLSAELIADSSVQIPGRPTGADRWWFLGDSVFALLSADVRRARSPYILSVQRAAHVVPINRAEPATELLSFPLLLYHEIGEGSGRTSPFDPPVLVAIRSRTSPRVYVAGADSTWEIRAFDANGELRQIIRANIPRQAVDQPFVERFRQSILTADQPEDYNRHLLDLYMTLLPDSTPAIDELHVDPSGQLWVRRWAMSPNARAVYDIFDIDGAWIGTVLKPAGLGTLLTIGADRVFLLYTDALGVQYLSIHQLRKIE